MLPPVNVNGERPKQIKNPWTEDEQKLFIEALDKYGPKNMKDISDYVRTRTVVQVRSHLQKHLLKESKKQPSYMNHQSNNSVITNQTKSSGMKTPNEETIEK